MSEIIQMNFSGVYRRQKFFEQNIEIDLTKVSGTNGYCSDEAAEEIRRRIADHPAEGIHLLDSGNYHYATLFWLEKIREPYDLLVFDHHTDMQPSAWGDELLSCGAWIRTALLMARGADGKTPLRHVWLAGPEEEAFAEAAGQPDLSAFTERIHRISKDDIERLIAEGTDRPLYISIDKDILSKEELDTNWDQGDWSLEELVSSLKKVCAGKRVIGIDICGEPDAQAHDAEIAGSQSVNEALLSAVRAGNCFPKVL